MPRARARLGLGLWRNGPTTDNTLTLLTTVWRQVYPVGIPALYAWLLFRHRHRIYPKQALRDGVSPERRLVDKKIAHTILLWKVRGCFCFCLLRVEVRVALLLFALLCFCLLKVVRVTANTTRYCILLSIIYTSKCYRYARRFRPKCLYATLCTTRNSSAIKEILLL